MLGHAAAATGGKIWMFGGQQGRKFLRTLFCFDTDICTWTRRETDAHPPARAGHSMVTVHGSVIYMFGGQGKRLYNDLHKLDPVTGNFTEVEASGKPPTPRRGHSLTWDGRDYLVCFGGINQSSTDAQLTVFSLSRGAWFTPQAFGPAPTARTQHTAQMLSPGIILIFGGCNSSGTFFNDAMVLDTRTFSWHKPALLNTAPAPRYHHTCNIVNGRIIVYGGINSKQTFDGVVVVETKFAADIANVAEELFRMSADPSSASVASVMHSSNANAIAANSPTAAVAAASRMMLGGGAVTAVSVSRAPPSTTSAAVTPTAAAHQHVVTPTQAAAHTPTQAAHTPTHQQHPMLQVVPAPGVSDFAAAMSSNKSLEAVKVQLTDLLLRRNLEEQQLQTARKAETTESLLVKEKEAREAVAKELMQHKLMLAEAEAEQAATQQQLQSVLSRAMREAAATAEMRGQLEVLQNKLASRDEELQEARLLQDGLVKELGIMASRYSRLAMDVQDSGDRGGGEGRGGGERGERLGGGGGHHASSSTQRTSLSSMLAQVHAGNSAALTSGTGVSGRNNQPGSALYQMSTGQLVSAAGQQELQASGSYSVPLPESSARSMLAARQSLVHGPLSTLCMAAGAVEGSGGSDAVSSAALARGAAAASGSAPGAVAAPCSNCCAQLLVLLSDAEMHRAALMESHSVLNDKVDELTAANSMLHGQLQQMHAEASALEPLALNEMEELERKLDCSSRSVRDALMKRKIDEAQRRSSSEQAACAVCMEGPKAVVFNCGHQSCEDCSGKMTNCPFCRVGITARIRLFDA